MESRKRALAKTITFRILATIATLIIVLLYTGDLKIAGIVTVIETIVKLGIYYIHERVWNKVHWGRTSSAKHKNEA